jgi:hypothetical protein
MASGRNRQNRQLTLHFLGFAGHVELRISPVEMRSKREMGSKAMRAWLCYVIARTARIAYQADAMRSISFPSLSFCQNSGTMPSVSCSISNTHRL